MKYVSSGVAYLQGADVAFMLHNVCRMPSGVVDECFGEESMIHMADKMVDGARFEYEFRRSVNVRWIREQKWLLDWDEVRTKTVAELKEKTETLQGTEDARAKKFDNREKEYHEENYADFIWAHHRIEHRILQLRIAAAYMEGSLWFQLPPGAKPATTLNLVTKVKHWFHK